MKLEINYRKKNGESTNMMYRLSNVLLINNGSMKTSREEIGKYLETIKMEL